MLCFWGLTSHTYKSKACEELGLLIGIMLAYRMNDGEVMCAYTLLYLCVVHNNIILIVLVILATHVEISEFWNPWPPKKKSMPAMRPIPNKAMPTMRPTPKGSAASNVAVVGWFGDACLNLESWTLDIVWPSNQLLAKTLSKLNS